MQEVNINERDVEITTTKGSGPGGQARNKLETAVILKHKSTGLVVRCESERSQYQNKIIAYEILESKLRLKNQQQYKDSISEIRKQQMGSGHRAEKIRTYMVKHNLAVDHRSNKKINLKDWLKGKWNINN